MLKRIFQTLIVVLSLPMFALAQTTTSSMSGNIKTAAGAPLVGATVTATHQPTGTVYKTQTRSGGSFTLSNMNPGGPYTVQVAFVNFATETRSEIFLNLGETYQLDLDLKDKANELAGVTVSTTRETAAKTGVEVTIGREKMENLPTVGRTLTDYLRATPQMKMSSAGNISSEGAMSFAGQNVRYNSFYVDGAVNNDQFGLAYSGTNGGQSGIAPLSIDAIDQFQVSISPFNASLGNFTGAAINAITKSGTNTLHGSGYYIFRNEKMTGKTPTGDKSLATRVSKFSNKTYGVTLGGPIVKNKAFFFVSAELQRDQTPLPFDINTYVGSVKDAATLQRLADTIAKRTGGFNVGGYLNNTSETKADRITAKIDWNLSERNKLALSYRYTSGDRVVPLDNGTAALRFETNGYRFPTKTQSASAELKSSFARGSSNRLLLTLTDVEDDRAPIGGQVIPAVQIFDGSTASIYFGTEASSTFNYLKQLTLNLVDQYKFTVGKHSFMTGVELESYKGFNSFIQNTAGNYRYNNIDSFFENKSPNQYIANFPLLGNDEKTTGSASEFRVFKGAAFINDEIRFNNNFTLSLGLRADYYKFQTTPRKDPFADTALAKLGQFYDLKGARAGVQPKVPVELSPRVGFTYRIPEENITIRGGFGLFAGRIPMVWPTAIYNNNGLAQSGYTLSSSQNTALLSKVKPFKTTAYLPSEIGLTLADARGTLVVTSEEIRMPKVFRTSLSVDKRFGKGWTATVEGMFSKNTTEFNYTNINLVAPTLQMATGPDKRLIYPSSNTIPIRTTGVANPYQAVYLISNAEGRKPFSYNFTASINKTSRTGLNASLSYTYGQTFILNEFQSSTPGSQWNSMETVQGRNYLTLSEGDNSMGHRVFAFLSKKFTYANKKAFTTVSLVYNGQSGQTFSYQYGNVQVVRDGQTNNDLIFVPTAAQLQTMTFLPTAFGGVTYTEQQQRDAFEQYIQNDKYLSKRRGDYAERNGARAPFTHVVDLKLTQGFNMKLGDKTYSAEIGYSMFNFTNFLNRDWGRQYTVAFDNYNLVGFSYASATNLTPRYTFDPRNNTVFTPYTVYNRFNPSYTARWMSQLEFRVRF
jgi:hypothetical protein